MLDADERWERGWGRFPERGNSFEGMLQCGGGLCEGDVVIRCHQGALGGEQGGASGVGACDSPRAAEAEEELARQRVGAGCKGSGEDFPSEAYQQSRGTQEGSMEQYGGP